MSKNAAISTLYRLKQRTWKNVALKMDFGWILWSVWWSPKWKGNFFWKSSWFSYTLCAEMNLIVITYNSECNKKAHVSFIFTAPSRMNDVLRQLKIFLLKPLLIQVYRAIIRSRMENCKTFFVNFPTTEAKRLEMQNLCHG